MKNTLSLSELNEKYAIQEWAGNSGEYDSVDTMDMIEKEEFQYCKEIVENFFEGGLEAFLKKYHAGNIR